MFGWGQHAVCDGEGGEPDHRGGDEEQAVAGGPGGERESGEERCAGRSAEGGSEHQQVVVGVGRCDPGSDNEEQPYTVQVGCVVGVV